MDFKDRLLIERNELKERLEKLNEFLSSSKPIDHTQMVLLRCQSKTMDSYLTILNERILLLDLQEA